MRCRVKRAGVCRRKVALSLSTLSDQSPLFAPMCMSRQPTALAAQCSSAIKSRILISMAYISGGPPVNLPRCEWLDQRISKEALCSAECPRSTAEAFPLLAQPINRIFIAPREKYQNETIRNRIESISAMRCAVKKQGRLWLWEVAQGDKTRSIEPEP